LLCKADEGLIDLVLKVEMLVLKKEFLKSQGRVGTVDPSVA
jgi:hypothetical protein